jgi:hypothetical protein
MSEQHVPWDPSQGGLGNDLRPTAVMALSGLKGKIGPFELSADHICRLALPKRFDRDHAKRLQRDFELLAAIAREHPQKIVEMQNAALHNDLPRTKRLADEIGLQEERFIREGGGWLLAAIIAVIVAVAIAANQITGSSTADEQPPDNSGDASDHGGGEETAEGAS